MKVFIKALVTGTAAAVLFFVGTGMAHADKGGSGGSRGGSSGGSAKSGSSVGSSHVSSSNSGSSMNKTSNFSNVNKTGNVSSVNKTGNAANVNKTNVAQNQQSQAKKVGSNQGTTVAKNNMGNQQNKMSQQNFKKDSYCKDNYWNKSCYPSCWNYGYNSCSYGYGCWNYPCYSSCYTPCYSPCYEYCSYPSYQTCYTTPVCYSCQAPVITTTQVIEVIQPAPVVETVTTTQTTQATATAVRPPSNDISFLTNSAVRPQ